MNLDVLVICTTVAILSISTYLSVRKWCNSKDYENQTKLQLRIIDSDIIKNLEMERVLSYLTLEKYRNSKLSLIHIEKPEVNLLPKNK